MMSLLSGILDFLAARSPRRPAAYLWLFMVWAVTLWFLSSGNPAPKDGPSIPHLDKLAHFTYFLIGGALLTFYGRLKWPDFDTRQLALTVAFIGCVIGRLDEYHQSFTPGRSGNDYGDWLADTLGVVAGIWAVMVLLLPRFHRV